MLEGNTNASWWDWKDSIGPLKDRPGYSGVWDYQQTNGLGCEFVFLHDAQDRLSSNSFQQASQHDFRGIPITFECIQADLLNQSTGISRICRGPRDGAW